MRIAFCAKEASDSHRARRSLRLTSVTGDDRVAGEVVGVQRLPFSFRELAPLLLVISLAQQLLLPWPESSGMGTAFGGGLAKLREIRTV